MKPSVYLLSVVFTICISSCTPDRALLKEQVQFDSIQKAYVYNGSLYTGVGYKLHKNDSVELEIPLLEGKEHGTVKLFFENGKPLQLLDYQNGQLHGKVKEYSDVGLKKVLEYQNGKLNGTVTTYRNSGAVDKVIHYKDSIQHGKHTKYDRDGYKEWENEYKDGIEDGVRKDWDKNQLTGEIHIEQGKEHGSYHRWWSNGNNMIMAIYKNGVPVGLYRTWHSNGKLESTKNYDENGREHGYSFRYNSYGQLVRRTQYDHGQVVYN